MTARPTSVNARSAHLRRHLATAIAITALVPVRLAAQAGLTRADDAAPLPRGYARLRVLPSWSRFDSRFTGGAGGSTSTAPLAAVLVAESLGVAQVPGLDASEQALRTLTGDPTFRLSLGRSVAVATARIVTTAFVAEYGLTRRLTVGGVLPLVQSRSELFLALNSGSASHANVGPYLRTSPSPQRTQAIALQSQLGSVRTTLQSRLDACDRDPTSDPACPTIIANRSDVQLLLSESAAFGSAVAVLFGASATAAAQPFAPLLNSSAAGAIDARLAGLRERFRTYLGSTADQITASVPKAAGPAAFGDLQQLLLQRELGLSPDSLDQVQRFNIGDIELRAKLLAFESGRWPPAAPAPPWLRTRLSFEAVVRLGTGLPTLPRLPHRYLEYGTGDGQTDIEGAALADVGLGPRITVMAAGRYTRQLGTVEAGRLPDTNGVVNPFTPLFAGRRKLGDIIALEVTPRVLLGRFFGTDVHYAMIHRADDEYLPEDASAEAAPVRRGGFTEQRVGLGLSYSTLRGARGRLPKVPVEVSVAHIVTVTGSSALVPRATRDQIELRLYYRVRPR